MLTSSIVIENGMYRDVWRAEVVITSVASVSAFLCISICCRRSQRSPDRPSRDSAVNPLLGSTMAAATVSNNRLCRLGMGIL